MPVPVHAARMLKPAFRHYSGKSLPYATQVPGASIICLSAFRPLHNHNQIVHTSSETHGSVPRIVGRDQNFCCSSLPPCRAGSSSPHPVMDVDDKFQPIGLGRSPGSAVFSRQMGSGRNIHFLQCPGTSTNLLIGCPIGVQSDNVTVVVYINHQGMSRNVQAAHETVYLRCQTPDQGEWSLH